MKILAVDTALNACSAALLDDARVLAHRLEPMERGHAERLAPMVEEVMSEARLDFATLDRLAVTAGPGTFTGQRVGLAFMRGLRAALHRPLIGVSTLAAMAAEAKAETGVPRAIALHDARRDEVYVEIEGLQPPAVLAFGDAIAMVRGLALELPFALAGTGASRACDALAGTHILSGVRHPDARWVARLAREMPGSDAPPQPIYLRAPDAKLATSKT